MSATGRLTRPYPKHPPPHIPISHSVKVHIDRFRILIADPRNKVGSDNKMAHQQTSKGEARGHSGTQSYPPTETDSISVHQMLLQSARDLDDIGLEY